MENFQAEPIFEIEDVLKRRCGEAGNLEYLIKWKGYPHKYNSWEPEGSLFNCRKVLKKFRMGKKVESHKTAGLAKAKELKVKALKSGMVTKASVARKRKVIPTTKAKGTNIMKSIVKRSVPLNRGGTNEKTTQKGARKAKAKDNVKVESTAKLVAKPDSEDSASVSSDTVPNTVVKPDLDSVDGIDETEVVLKSDSKTTEETVVSSQNKGNNNNKSFNQKKAAKDNHVRYKLNPSALRELTRLVADEKGNADALKQIEKLCNSTKSGSVSLKAISELVTKEAEVKDRTRRKKEREAIIKKAATENNNRKRKSAANSAGSPPKRRTASSAQAGEKKTSAKSRSGGKTVKQTKAKKGTSTTFQPTKSSPKQKKSQPKTEIVKPVPRMSHAKSGPSILHIPTASAFTAFKTPHDLATTSAAATIVRQPPQLLVLDQDHYFPEIPACTVPVTPLFPSSPTTESYRSLVMNLPAKLQSNRLVRRRNSKEEEDEIIQRRLSVRQSESAFKYKEIVVKKFDHYTQIWLFTNTKMGNALNPEVFQELISAFNNAKYDDSVLVMLSGTGSLFCSGIDLAYLINADNRKKAAEKMVVALRDFLQTLISFPKPIVVAVNGPAIGLGATILPLCDVVYASDKASFYLPYSRLAQTPEGCSSFTFPSTLGMAMANEMLYAGRKLTAMEAYQSSLVSQVFWPTTMMQEVVPRVQQMASQSARALEATKLMIRSHIRAKLDYTNDSECNMLKDCWLSPEFYTAAIKYLGEERHFL